MGWYFVSDELGFDSSVREFNVLFSCDTPRQGQPSMSEDISPKMFSVYVVLAERLVNQSRKEDSLLS